MIIRLSFVCLLCLAAFAAQAQQVVKEKMWATLTAVKWNNFYDEALGFDVSQPLFTPEIKALAGKEISIRGYVMPVETDGSYMVLSALPYANCFFCGGAGPETVMELDMAVNRRLYNKLVTIKGKLKLNASDPYRLIYQLVDAKVEEEWD